MAHPFGMFRSKPVWIAVEQVSKSRWHANIVKKGEAVSTHAGNTRGKAIYNATHTAILNGMKVTEIWLFKKLPLTHQTRD